MHLARRAAVIALVVAMAVHVGRGTLSAHAMLIAADPAAESVVAVSPSRIRLLFSEEIEPSLASIVLVASDGGVTKLSIRSDPHDVHAVTGAVTSLPRGAYRVQWHVVSADGHPVGGSFVFWVGEKDTAAPAPITADENTINTVWGPSVAQAPLIPALLRGLAVGVAMALAGLLLFLTDLRSAEVIAVRPERAARWLAIATPLLLVVSAIAWAANASASHHLTSADLQAAFTSGVGRLDLWRIGLAILAVWAFLLARRPRIALGFSAAVLALSGATGHSAAIRPIVAIPAKSLHLLGGAAWLGGLLWLLLLQRSDRDRYAAEAVRVSSVALWASGAVAASGILMSALFLSTPRDLVATAYGLIVLAKSAGLLVLLSFGAYHRFRAVPALGANATPTKLATSVRREVAIFVIVVFLGGLLAYVPPSRPAARSTPPSTAPVE